MAKAKHQPHLKVKDVKLPVHNERALAIKAGINVPPKPQPLNPNHVPSNIALINAPRKLLRQLGVTPEYVRKQAVNASDKSALDRAEAKRERKRNALAAKGLSHRD